MAEQQNLYSNSSENIEKLVSRLKQLNESYRAGIPEISDMEYDNMVEELRSLDPNHSFLQNIEPEELKKGQTVRHKKPMLSLEKAYTTEQISRFIQRVEKFGAEYGLSDLTFRVTPKLDGMAGNDEDNVLASRGNGLSGNNISHIFDRGVVPVGGRNQGLGEIVMSLSYFHENFAGEFTHPRNMVAGIVNADEINASAMKALKDKQVHFMPYSELAKVASWFGDAKNLVENMEEITQSLAQKTDYPLDGMVVEVTEKRIQETMGSTSHHNRWQIAVKTRGETATTIIEEIGWQTGRTGTVTPVLRVRPTKLSGAMISNITAHHAGMVRSKALGIGAKIEIIRSGEVIPKLEKVLEPAVNVVLPSLCPSCDTPLEWDGDFLKCTNKLNCPAQTESGIRHWFKMLGSADGFGPKTVEKMVESGFVELPRIYAMTLRDFINMGMGDKQSENLLVALEESRKTLIEDARFLAAFGIPNLGIGDSRKLLAHHKIETLGNIEAADLLAIKGFGDKTSGSIAESLQNIWQTIEQMLELGFSLEKTPHLSEMEKIESPIAGKSIMFTGKMQGSRTEMQEKARNLGATVLSSISSKLQILVIGEKPSQSKINKANDKGIEILKEDAYQALIGD